MHGIREIEDYRRISKCERISDILKLDQEKEDIWSSYSKDQVKEIRKIYNELPSCWRRSIKELQEAYEGHSDDERKNILEILKRYNEHPDDVRRDISKINYMKNPNMYPYYRDPYWHHRLLVKGPLVLNDEQKILSEFLSKEGSPIFLINYPGLCERVLQQDATQAFFELGFLMGHEEEKDVLLSDHVRDGILKLSEELKRVLGYHRCIEAKNDKQEFKLDCDLFYLKLSDFANESEEILDHVFSNEAVASDIQSLIKNIPDWNQLLHFQITSIITITHNVNYSGEQILGNNNSYVPGKPSKQVSRPISYGHVKNTDVVGFKDEIDTLFNHLMQDDKTHVVGIIGMGGSGKTTLAKHIYHNPHIMTKFCRKVWVCISESWDKASILNKILIEADEDPNPTEMGYDQLVPRLFKLLSSQSYLVILDDIWSIDAWYDIRSIFPAGSGSKVVVTTRMKALPQRIDPNVFIVEPKHLNDIESYELFRRRVNESIPHNLLQLGMEMVKKCRGLPLAIVALAGVLMENKTQSNWERLRQEMLNISTDSTGGVVKEILALSYNELPPHLRPCVHYLRIFPEDYEIKAKELIKMWIAECLINTEGDPIFTAKECLKQIVRRCIVDVVESDCMGEVKKFRIHDLIRQMIIDKDRKKERGIFKDPLRLVPISTTQCGGKQKNNTSATSDTVTDDLKRIFGSERNSHARSLIFFNHLDLDISESILHRLFVESRLLRVLILRHFSGSNIPEELGNLIHLRHLELGGRLKKFPKSIKNLKNLWTLDITNIYLEKWNETALNILSKFKELRHLYLPQLGSGWKKLNVKETKLKTLWNARGGEWMLSGMLELSDVLENLCIRDIEDKQQLEAVFKTPSITSDSLQTLEIWYGSYAELCDMSILGKCKSLERLKLCGAIRVSTTIMLPPNLIELEMEGTCLKEIQVMEMINDSCRLLKILTLGKGAYDGSELICTANSFSDLEKLTFKDLDIKLWIIEESAMPNLHHLEIVGCKDMDLNPQGWIRISNIPLECMDLSPEFEGKLRIYKENSMDQE